MSFLNSDFLVRLKLSLFMARTAFKGSWEFLKKNYGPKLIEYSITTKVQLIETVSAEPSSPEAGNNIVPETGQESLFGCSTNPASVG